MTNLSHITWEPKYTVSDEKIDGQHRELFALTNKLIDLFESGSEGMFPVLKGLVDYLSIHFHTENMFMMKHNYPDFMKHTLDHQKFNTKIGQFISSFKAEKQDLASEMVAFLRNWVFSHTTTMDLLYGEHARKQKQENSAR